MIQYPVISQPRHKRRVAALILRLFPLMRPLIEIINAGITRIHPRIVIAVAKKPRNAGTPDVNTSALSESDGPRRTNTRYRGRGRMATNARPT
jgi:hypothetical protein